MAKVNKKQLKNDILELFKKNPNKPLNYKQVANMLGFDAKSKRRIVIQQLDQLRKQGILEEVKKGKYKIRVPHKKVIGYLDLSMRDFPIVKSDDLKEEIYIPVSKLNHALHRDKVEVIISARPRKKGFLQGEITKVIERNKRTFVGTVVLSKHYAFLSTNYKCMPYDIFIPAKNLNGAKNGDKALVRVVEWPEYAKNPVGEIVEVIGKAGKHETEMHAILAEFDLPYKFPERVLKAAEDIPSKITPEDIKARRDMRNVLTFTIDPADAKDFDDALSFRKIKDNVYEIGVHIADVTHYVKPGTILDKEAEERGTSVYLVDRVVPMLPERLSNELCSLNPHTDKLTFSVIFTMDENGKIRKKWIGKTIINSDRRFNYDEVQQIIETGKGDHADAILFLDKIAKQLRAKRFKNGAISFERGEMKFKLDKNGKPIEVYYKTMKDANHLVEEFMLLANRTVAERIGKVPQDKKPKTFVYRVHDEPDMEKLRNFAQFIKKFGYSINLKTPKTIALSLNKLFEEVKDKPVAEVIATLGIRSMAKAKYSTDNIGHYGLGFAYYTHFTSPIRRYPDMMVHRLLERYLIEHKPSVNKDQYEKKCKHASEMEQTAQQAEWASIKYKAVEFMKDKMGEEFIGIISGLNEWGIFVQLVENNIEGTVLIRDIEEDFYVYDEANYCLIGEYSGNKFQVGDKIKVKVARADLEKRQLDFILVEKITDYKQTEEDIKSQATNKKQNK